MWSPEVVGLDASQRQVSETIPAHLRKRIAFLQPEGPLFFGIADSLYRQADRLVHYDVLIISLTQVPIVDLSGAFSLEDMILLAQKRDTKVILKGLNSSVRRILNELGILQKIGEENIVETFDQALGESVDYLADQFLAKSSPA